MPVDGKESTHIFLYFLVFTLIIYNFASVLKKQ